MELNQIINNAFTGMALLAVAIALLLVYFAIDSRNNKMISKKTKKTP